MELAGEGYPDLTGHEFLATHVVRCWKATFVVFVHALDTGLLDLKAVTPMPNSGRRNSSLFLAKDGNTLVGKPTKLTSQIVPLGGTSLTTKP